jgi:hypothetical protein
MGLAEKNGRKGRGRRTPGKGGLLLDYMPCGSPRQLAEESPAPVQTDAVFIRDGGTGEDRGTVQRDDEREERGLRGSGGKEAVNLGEKPGILA